MSMKKATPQAVFAACEQLALLDRPWNRDDVRITIGGGSFSVIDPLIQAWRKMQPVREVAPSLPTDLLIQIATLLEQQVSSYLNDIDERDRAREHHLQQMVETLTDNFEKEETERNHQLEMATTANHELEAECSRLEIELKETSQQVQTLAMQKASMEESVSSLKQQLIDQKIHTEQALQQQKDAHLNAEARLHEQSQRVLEALKAEQDQQLARQLSEQKRQLTDAAEMAENRLMKLLDQTREELKEVRIDMRNEALSHQQQQSQLTKDNSLLIKEKQVLAGRIEHVSIQHQQQIETLIAEKAALSQRIETQDSHLPELESLRSSIQLLQTHLDLQAQQSGKSNPKGAD